MIFLNIFKQFLLLILSHIISIYIFKIGLNYFNITDILSSNNKIINYGINLLNIIYIIHNILYEII